jgi:alpha-D-xyloside xylohydrolase
LPPGRWFSFWDSKEIQGGRWLKEKYGFFQLPLFVREGTILLLGQSEGVDGFSYDWLKSGGEIRLYGAKEGDMTVLVDTHGDEKGILEVKANGELTGLDLLQGEWQVVKLG